MSSSAKTPITAIDTHAHIFHTNISMTEQRRYAPEYDALASDFLKHLTFHKISHGVLVQPSFLGTDNNYMLTALREHPERLRGIAVVDMAISDQELDELEKAGVVGIRFNLIKQPLEDYRSPEWKAFLGRIAKRQWVVEIQRELEDLASFLPAILESGVDIIVDHFGRTLSGIQASNPTHKAFLDLLSSGARVWTKVSAAYRCNATLEEAQEMLITLRSAYGHSDLLLWGSDWPHTQFESETNYTKQYDFMKSLLPNADDRKKVLISNPTKLFKF